MSAVYEKEKLAYRLLEGAAGAADGLNEGLLDDAVLDVQAQLAGTLLGSTPAICA